MRRFSFGLGKKSEAKTGDELNQLVTEIMKNEGDSRAAAVRRLVELAGNNGEVRNGKGRWSYSYTHTTD